MRSLYEYNTRILANILLGIFGNGFFSLSSSYSNLSSTMKCIIQLCEQLVKTIATQSYAHTPFLWCVCLFKTFVARIAHDENDKKMSMLVHSLSVGAFNAELIFRPKTSYMCVRCVNVCELSERAFLLSLTF